MTKGDSRTPLNIRVAVDARGLEPNFRAHFGRGTGRYVREVLNCFDCIDTENIEITRIQSKDLALSPFQKKFSGIIPAGKVTFETQFCLNKNITKLEATFAHFFFHGDAPAFPITPQVVSVLDLIPLKFPELYQKGVGGFRYKFARYLEDRAIRAAIGLIAISEATKRDIIEIMKLPEEIIEVVPLGVDKSFFQNQSIVELDNNSFWETKKILRSKKNLPKEGFLGLYVGGIDARKNIPFLIDVISELNSINEISSKGGVHLALAGNYEKDDQLPKLKEQIRRLKLEERVHLLGFIDDSSLRELFTLSDLFLFPSLYEGFGLPVLESMASGLPVIAGNNSSLPEVMGERGWKFSDGKVIEWVKGIQEVLPGIETHSENLRREIDLSKERARSFTWEKTAEGTINAYKKFSAQLNNKA